MESNGFALGSINGMLWEKTLIYPVAVFLQFLEVVWADFGELS